MEHLGVKEDIACTVEKPYGDLLKTLAFSLHFHTFRERERETLKERDEEPLV